MCILCIASRWSRHIAAMVMPMVTLWALSQFLPQGFRFEINSPKLACVGVLFVSLSWFELVMPRLSAWRARRISAQKERKRVEAQEAAKRRKKATRRCRNCFTAYKDQMPASGRFMCTFCGHVSKRPVLDLPVGASSSRSSFSLSGSAVELLSGSGLFPVSVSPKYWYDRASFVRPSWGSGRSWIGVGPWIDGASWGMSTSWFGGSWPSGALYFGNTGFGWPGSAGNLLGDGVFGGERWFAGDSYSGVVWFVLRVFSQLLVFTLWIWRKLSRTEYVEENGINRGHEDQGDVVGASLIEAKDKKARRKAEEKRLSRLEREHQEAEEKKQREEVARLVEERRRLRVKIIESNKTISTVSGKEIEAERFHERRHEKSRDTKKECGTEELTKKSSFAAAKNMKPSRILDVKDKEANVKAPSTFFSKWSRFKSQEPAKSRLFAHSRNAAVLPRTPAPLLNDVVSPSKPCQISALVDIGPSSSVSSSDSKLSEHCFKTSGSGGIQTPWVKVLSCGALGISANTSEDAIIRQIPCKQENSNENDGSMRSSLEKTVSHLMVDTSHQHFETAARAFENVRDVGGECSQPIDLLACQHTESTISNFEGNDHINATAKPFSLSTGRSTNLEPTQYSASSAHSNMPEFFDTNCLPRVASSSFLSDFTGKKVQNPISGRPTVSSAVMIHETETSLPLPVSKECLSPSESLESFQSWEPWTVSADCRSGLVPQEKWQHGLYPSLMNTSPVDASLQQREDFDQQTTFNPEFYLPSSLFSCEESDTRECCCEDRILGKKSCLEFGAAAASELDLDVHYKIPPEFVDCITHSLMQDPVITADGHSYERSAIEDWLKSHDTSPKTGEVLPPPPGGKGVDKTLRPNHILRCQIIEFRERLFQRNETRAGLMTSVNGHDSDGFVRHSAQSLANNLLPVQVLWSHDVFGEIMLHNEGCR